MNHLVFVLFLPLLLLFLPIYSADVGKIINVGTSLYTRRDLIKNWTDIDVIGLQIRMMVDQLLPRRIPDAASFVKYLKLMANKSEIIDNDKVRRQTMIMVADVMGGYMHGVLLPRVKASYYEGHVGFDVTNELHGMLRKIKFVLDTDGRGWIPSSAEDEEAAPAVSSGTARAGQDDIGVRYDDAEDPCAGLHVERPFGDGGDVEVSVPGFDDDRRPGSLAVPFASGKRLFALDEPAATSDGPLLVRYYRLAVGCTSASPFRFRRDVRRWLDAVVTPLLVQGHPWYPALASAWPVVRAAARAPDNGRRKRTATTEQNSDARPDIGLPAGEDLLPTCDDGPDGRLPNTNLCILVVLVSLLTVWLYFGVAYGSRKIP